MCWAGKYTHVFTFRGASLIWKSLGSDCSVWTFETKAPVEEMKLAEFLAGEQKLAGNAPRLPAAQASPPPALEVPPPPPGRG